jgi:PKD repeat protein
MMLPCRSSGPRHFLLAAWMLMSLLASTTSGGGSALFGTADGSFETGLQSATTAGDVRLVEAFGGLRPTQGTQAVLLTTQPDGGTSPGDADMSLLRLEHITIPAEAQQLRLDVNMLSNELTPSFTNDRFTVEIDLLSTEGTQTLLQVDTFATMYPASTTGFARQTGMRTLVVDLTPYTTSGEEVTLTLRLADGGDGRVDSALLLDNLRWVNADEPQAVANLEYIAVAPGEIVYFDGSGSRPGENDIVEYHWGFGDGNMAVGLFVEHTYTQEGLHQATLTVTDQTGNTYTDTFLVMVRGTSPVPHMAGPALLAETAASGGQWSATFDASGSSDDTSIATYIWDFGDGSTGTGINPTHLYTAPGTYTVSLTVTDHAGQQTTMHSILVVKANHPPVADAGGPYVLEEADADLGVWTVTFDGTNSTDDVALHDYEWTMEPEVADDFTGTTIDPATWLGSAGVTQNETLNLVGAGAWDCCYHYSVRNIWHAAEYVLQAQIRPLNTSGNQQAVWGLRNANATSFAPTTMAYAIGFSNQSFQIYARGKSQGTVGVYTPGVLYDIRIRLQSSGAIYEFKPADATAWTHLYTSTFIPQFPLRVGGAVFSGEFSVDNLQFAKVLNGPVVTQSYTTPGTYHATLRVRDRALQTDTDTTVIALETGAPPVAHAGGPYVLAPDGGVHFSASASSDDVAIVKYLWDFGDGTFSTEVNPVHVYAAARTYVVTLTVIDNGLQMDRTAVTVQDSRVTVIDTSGVTVHGQTLQIVGTVSAQVLNPDTAAMGAFTLTFYDDSNSNGRFDAGVDTVLGSTTQSGIPAQDSILVSTEVSGVVSFRDAPIYASLTMQDGLPVSFATQATTTQACTFSPPVGAFSPFLEWEWRDTTTLPSSQYVMMAPAVIDMTADGIPDVIFTSFSDRSFTANGHLRAINGNDGSAIFTVTDARYDVRGAGNIAVGDIDLDGRPEILAVAEAGNQLIAFEHDGTFKWRSPTLRMIHRGGAAIADLDRDGTPEIVIGPTVLNHDGSLRWTGTQGRGDNSVGSAGPVSLVANLDLTDNPEIIAGNTAYRADGSLYWYNATLKDGFNAIANFDADPLPEIVLVAEGAVYLLEHDGRVTWGPTPLPGGGNGGPPTVADMDGDGEPEIGVAGADAYTVFETDGMVKWSRQTRDHSSHVTGSAVFDFDNDGLVEVVYRDEVMLRIYRGSDGSILWETPSRSSTAYELPIIVDVDADGNAEIVMVSDNYVVPGGAGIRVYGDANDTWGPTRQLWNQHTYHVTNVHDDGTIPFNESPSWLGHNTYRLNLETTGQVLAAPDVTASFVRLSGSAPAVTLTARIGNAGALVVPKGVPVSFYDGDPYAGGTRLGTVLTTHALASGAYTDVTLTMSGETRQTVWVIADDDGLQTGIVSECREDNNRHDSGMRVQHNRPPLVEAGADQIVRELCAVGAGASVTLMGSGFDPDNDPLTFVWQEDGIPVATGATPTVNLPVGVHTLELTATDVGGLTHTDTVVVTVHKIANINLDTIVDMADLLAVITVYGPAEAATASADINCDGTVYREDTTIVLSQYGQASP